MNKQDAKKKLEELLEIAKKNAAAAGLKLTLDYKIIDPETEKLQAQLQANLNSAQGAIHAAVEIAKKLGLDEIKFMHSIVKWSARGIEADGGPRIWNEWNESTFDCHGTAEQYEWVYGEGYEQYKSANDY